MVRRAPLRRGSAPPAARNQYSLGTHVRGCIIDGGRPTKDRLFLSTRRGIRARCSNCGPSALNVAIIGYDGDDQVRCAWTMGS